jgi:LCP family protein required for cell wall assembly
MRDEQNKDHRHGRKPLSIDGFTPSKPRKSSSSIGFDKPLPGRPNRRLDDFGKPEGMGPAKPKDTSTLSVPRRPQYGHPQEKKRYYLRFWKNRQNKKLDSYEKKARRKKRLKIAGIIIFVILAIFGFLVAKGYINLRKVLSGGGSAAALDENVDPSKLRIEGDGRVNILVMGRGGAGHDGPDLTDTMILVSIDPVAKEAGMVSIPRDLYVSVPGQGSMKINSVFYTGKAQVLNKTYKRTADVQKQAEQSGFNLADKTVSDVLGVPVHYHVMVDFSAFQEAINTVGGVDINVPSAVAEGMRIDGRNYYLNVKPGPHHFGGFEALAYTRSRHTTKRGDFDRAERQRLMILALKEKEFSLSTFSNPAKISALIGQFGNHVQTNFSTQDITKLYELGKQINSSKFKSLGLSDPPHILVTTANIGGLSVVVPTAGLYDYKDIQYYIRNTLRDSFLKMEDAKVLVLNGTARPGLGGSKGYELKSYGYKVTKVDNAPTKDYSKTVIIDMGHGDKKYTRHYLENRFKVISTRNLPDATIQPGDADFVIILGNDISSE